MSDTIVAVRHLLLIFAAALSLMLCAATIVLWERSHRLWEWAAWQASSGRVFTVTSRLGGLDFDITDGWPFGEVFRGRWHVASDPLLVRSLPPPTHAFMGFGADDQTYGIGVQRTNWGGTAHRRSVIVPHWVVAVIFVMFGLACSTPLLRERRRRRRGLCRRCGYDLRASPERCPECGEPNYALSRSRGGTSIGGMADRKQKQAKKKAESGNPLHPGADDPRHAPESGEQGEIDDVEERGARGEHAGERDESGRLGPD